MRAAREGAPPARSSAPGSRAALTGQAPGLAGPRALAPLRSLAAHSGPQQPAQAHAAAAAVPSSVEQVLASPGAALPQGVRRDMEHGFGRDFSRVRLHADDAAARSAREVDANAYASGRHVVFDTGQYAPHTPRGRLLLAHELAHTIQQGGGAAAPGGARPLAIHSSANLEQQADRAALQVLSGRRATGLTAAPSIAGLQRQGPRVSLRSPVFEETVTQASDIAGSVGGRSLTRDERALAQPIFGSSIDYARVRLVTFELLEFRTVGNNIYIPPNFSVADAYMAQTLIHELTHVWQYQHGGTGYISDSLTAQIGAAMSGRSRNVAYDYRIQAGQSFFDFRAEQQGAIVENDYAMLRDQRQIPADLAAGVGRQYNSNHMGADGFPVRLGAAQRLAEIASELPAHESLLQQVRAALPRREMDLLHLRASEVMRSPLDELAPPERRMMPVRPLLELRF